MKKNSIFFCFFILIIACKTTEKTVFVENKEAIKTNVDIFLNNWHLAATQANFDDYFDKMDSVSVFIGTDPSENWTKTEFAKFSKPYFDKGKAWDFKTLERNIYVHNSRKIVWFDELLKTWMGVCRGSGVLEKKGNEWKIKHYVLSVAIPNDDIKAVIAAKKKRDSIFLSKF
jgi:hypothetical protein